MDIIETIEIFGREQVQEIWQDKYEDYQEAMRTITAMRDEPLSPYLELAKKCIKKYGKKWFKNFLEERLEGFKKELQEMKENRHRILVDAIKRNDQPTIDFINYSNTHDAPSPIERQISHHQRLVSAYGKRKKQNEITEMDIERAKQVPLDELYEIISRSRFVCCPFHEEKTPSCKLYADHFYCYGCHERGSVIDWVMKTQGLGFKDAVLFILKR